VKILIRATNWIGDAVMSLPAIRAVRGRFPAAELCILARPWVAAVYEGESAIDRILPLRGGRLAAMQALRKEQFDLAIALPNSFDSALILWGAGIGRRIGYARDGRSFLLTDAVRRPKPGSIPRHERYYYLELLRRAGIIETVPVVNEIHLEGREQARARGAKLIGTPRAIGVSPGAAYGTAKRWLPERFAEAAAAVAERIGASILVFGSAAEKELCARVASRCGGRNLAGTTTLREFIDMTAACSVYLSNDSGAMHLAAALRVPSVTVFGPTDEMATGPVAANASLLRQPVECSPCLKRECPIDHRCMTRVSAEMVAAEAIRLISVQ
jgi:heptosyltransferase-2